MSKIYLVYDEYCCDDEKLLEVFPCVTMEVAIKKLQERLKWNLENTYLNQFVDENLKLTAPDDLSYEDIWEVDKDSVEIWIESMELSLNIHIAEEEIITE
jgi:uncharacterized protein (DUF2344 family)